MDYVKVIYFERGYQANGIIINKEKIKKKRVWGKRIVRFYSPFAIVAVCFFFSLHEKKTFYYYYSMGHISYEIGLDLQREKLPLLLHL